MRFMETWKWGSKLHISIILLLCLLILCITRAADTPLRRLGLKKWPVFFLAIASLLCSGITLQPLPEFGFNVASILLCIGAGIAAGRVSSVGRIVQTLACAVLSGILMALLSRAVTLERISLPEPEFFIALCLLPAMLVLREEPAAALFCAALSPLLMTVFEACLDLYAFGYTVLMFGTPVAFDAQVTGVFLFGILLSIFPRREVSEA